MADLNSTLQESGNNQVDIEVMGDFFDDFKAAHQTCDSVLIELEDDPENDTLLNSLFRSIHTIKGNLVYVGLKDLTPLIQSLEDLLDAIRKKTITYDSLLCDVILLTLDRTESMVLSRVNPESEPLVFKLSDSDIDNLCVNISCIADVAPESRIEYIRACLFVLDPDSHLEANDQFSSSTDKVIPNSGDKELLNSRELKVNTDYLISNESVKHKEFDDVLKKYGVEVDEDIYFFKNLSTPLENRSFYWKGRTLRLLILSLAMNKCSGDRVNSSQLAVAVMMHDLGMSFLSRSSLTNTGAFSETEIVALHRHPGTSSLLLSEFENWGKLHRLFCSTMSR
ncbi:Hpt domain-containing protein [Shewanella woodyi]|uniref:Hpt domain-containing protein n=1 Tax=Shewanella woodyi TaxID=60961 RepID=UPI003747DF33